MNGQRSVGQRPRRSASGAHRNLDPVRFAALAIAILVFTTGCWGSGGSGGNRTAPGQGQAPEIRTLSIAGVFLEEGSDGGTTALDFMVTLDAPGTSDISVDYATRDVTTEASDFAHTGGRLTIPAGDTEATISIGVVADTAFELNEEFDVVLSNPSANATIGSGEALGRIVNDDPLSIVFDLVDLGFFDLATQGKATRLGFEYLIVDIPLDFGDRLLDFDIYFQADELHLPWLVASGSVQITGGSGTASGRIVIELPPGLGGFGVGGQFLIEFDWSALAGVSIPIDYTFISVPVDAQDIEPGSPVITVADVSVDEGDAGNTTDMVFDLALDQPVAVPVVLSYVTADATAISPDDYLPASGTVTIPAGQTSAAISVTVNGDDEVEGLDSLLVGLSLDSGPAVLLGTRAVGYIVNDDVAQDFRRITVANAELVEGDAGSTSMVFELTLDQPALTPVSVTFATRDDSAEAGSDYEATSDTRTFQAGESRLSIPVPVFGDTEAEDDETFVLEVTATSANSTIPTGGIGTIRSDDPLARVSIADLALAEGDAGTTSFAFAVTLSEALDQPLELDFATGDLTATAGEDYTARDASITVPAGDLNAVIEISVDGDNDSEDDEVFQVVLATASTSVILLDDTAEGTILNDDGDGGWAGEELVHEANPTGFPGTAVQPQVGFGPGGERHVAYLQNFAVWSRVSSARGIWEAPEQVATTGSMFRSPRLVVDEAGRALAAWPDTVVASSSYLAGAGWQSEPLPLAIEVRNELRLAGDPASGEAIVLWDEPFNAGNGNVTSVWAARFVPGAGWQDMALVETADGEAFIGDVAMGANGAAMAVFMQPAPPSLFTDIVAYRLVGSAWVGPTVLDTVDTDYANLPRIDTDAAGNAAVTWFQDEPVASGIPRSSIYVNRYDAASDQWSGAVLVEDDTTHTARDPDVAIDADGNVFVLWLQQSPDYSTEDLMANRYDAASDTWSGARLLEFDDTATGRPIVGQQIVADDLGNAIAVWIQNDGVQQNVRTARYASDGAQWLPPELLEELDTGDANGPHLVIDRASGDAMAVWHQANGSDVDIWANRYTNR